MSLETEVWLGCGYVLFLVTVAGGLLFAARRRTPPEWPHVELPGFHRGMARIVVILAGFVLLVLAVRNPDGATLAIVGSTLAPVGWAAWSSWCGR